jgi:drug/metabolite transporter (DMT)-like permease
MGSGQTSGKGSADLGLLLMAVIWGVNFPVIKAALGEIPPLAFNALRFPLAALTILIILRWKEGYSWPERADWPRVFFLGILGNVVYQGFFIFGVDATLAGNASILLATIPLWTLILSTLLRHEEPTGLVWIGILATLAGMVMVVLGGDLTLGFQGGTLKGDLLMVGAAVTWSIYAVGSKKLVTKYGPLPVTAWTLWIGTAGLVLWGAPTLTSFPISAPSALSWVGVVYAGVMAIGLAYLLWNRGVRRIGSSRTAAYQNLVPVVALLVAWLWLGEVPRPLQMAGAGVVLVGITLTRRASQGKK